MSWVMISYRESLVRVAFRTIKFKIDMQLDGIVRIVTNHEIAVLPFQGYNRRIDNIEFVYLESGYCRE